MRGVEEDASLNSDEFEEMVREKINEIVLNKLDEM